MKLTTITHSSLQGKDYAETFDLTEIVLDYVNEVVRFEGKDSSGDEVEYYIKMPLAGR